MPRFHPLRIASVRPETEDTISVTFDVPPHLADAYRFVQGQHLTLRCEIGGEEVRRSYSICSGVHEGELRIAIKRLPGGVFSTYAGERLRPGEVVDVMTPIGRFFTPLDPASRKGYVAFAAGSGITPVLSIVKSALAVEPHSRFMLFFGNRTSASIIFREELEDLKNRYLGRFSLVHIFSREPQDIELLQGRIDGAKVERLCRSLIRVDSVDEFFICGPEAMIDEVVGRLKRLGVDPRRIHFELFNLNPNQVRPPAPRPEAAPVEGRGEASRITVILDGKPTEFALPYRTDSILEAGRAAGADLPFACKSGVCCTCRARLIEGKVDMAVNYALEPAEVEAGFVLTCQSRPLTDRVVVDYDST
jgi:ring-1,2-phenylacetyl-CoA epoxidase subunit PaaE